MAQDTLTEILGVETEIRRSLEEERQKVGQWLQQARLEFQQAHQAELARLRDSSERDLAAAKQAARDEAAGIVREAEVTARAARELTDEQLRRLVRRHIAPIAPGTSHDH